MTGDVSVSASPRAVFWSSMCSLSAIERLFTIGTSKRATGIAQNRTRGTWCKFSATLSADFYQLYIRHTSGFKSTRMIRPVGVISSRMTGWTKSNKVIEIIGLPVIIKKMEWGNVMNRKTLIHNATTLTGVIVPLTSLTTLAFPIWPTVFSVPPKPRWIVFSAPSPRGAPSSPTFSVTKIVIRYLARLLFYRFPASITLDRYPFAAPTKPALTLPDSVTPRAAKPGFVLHIRFYLKRLRADFTNQCFHNVIIPRMDVLYKRTYCK